MKKSYVLFSTAGLQLAGMAFNVNCCPVLAAIALILADGLLIILLSSFRRISFSFTAVLLTLILQLPAFISGLPLHLTILFTLANIMTSLTLVSLSDRSCNEVIVITIPVLSACVLALAAIHCLTLRTGLSESLGSGYLPVLISLLLIHISAVFLKSGRRKTAEL